MRIAVISDVHANLLALDAVLGHVGSVDAIWQLGDVVGYGPEPDAVVARLAGAGAIGVRGNHDSAAAGGSEIDWFNSDARAAMEWTRRTIAASTVAWLSGWPLRREEAGFTLAHGSPLDPTWEYVTTPEAARDNLKAISTEHGSTGTPMSRSRSASTVTRRGASRRATARRPTRLSMATGSCSTRGVSASHVTVIRGPATCCSISRRVGRTGTEWPTTSTRCAPRCARQACRSGSANAFAMVSEA